MEIHWGSTNSHQVGWWFERRQSHPGDGLPLEGSGVGHFLWEWPAFSSRCQLGDLHENLLRNSPTCRWWKMPLKHRGSRCTVIVINRVKTLCTLAVRTKTAMDVQLKKNSLVKFYSKFTIFGDTSSCCTYKPSSLGLGGQVRPPEQISSAAWIAIPTFWQKKWAKRLSDVGTSTLWYSNMAVENPLVIDNVPLQDSAINRNFQPFYGLAEAMMERCLSVEHRCPGGMLIFALLLSLITSAFEDFLWQIRHGSLPVVEGAASIPE